MSEELVAKNSDLPAQGAPGPALDNIDARELGVTGLRRFSGFVYEEFLPELTGWQGLRTYTEMSRNDATVGAVLYAIKTLCRKVKWFCDPATDDPEDVAAAEFLETCLNDMSQTWTDTVNEILSMLEFGHSAQEIVYKKRGGHTTDPTTRSDYEDGRVGWRKLSIRSQDTIYRWRFDDTGGILGFEQLAPPYYLPTVIPIEKLLLFRTSVDKNNPEGRSILRTAYRSWYMKKNIENVEAIGVERDLAGLPVALVPPEILSRSASENQKNLAAAIRNIVINVRRNSQEGILFPQSYDHNGKPQYELKLLSTGGQRQFNTNDIVTRYDQRIAMSVLADFILLGMDKVGSYALNSTKTNLFSTAIGAFLDIICDVMNRYAVPRLFAVNTFKITGYPKLKHGDLGSVDLNELGAYLQRLAQSGVIFAGNPEIEKHLFDVAGIPTTSMTDPKEPLFPIAPATAAQGVKTEGLDDVAADDPTRLQDTWPTQPPEGLIRTNETSTPGGR